MNTSKYSKLIDKIARKLNNGSLKQEYIHSFMEAELGKKVDIDGSSHHKSMDEIDISEAKQKFNFKYKELTALFFKIWTAINDIEKRANPITIRFNSKIIVSCFDELKKYKNDENYDKVLINAIALASKFRDDLTITKEYIKILDKKYLITY